MSSNVVHAAPPAPPPQPTFDYTRFRGNAATRILDTINKEINVNKVSANAVVTGRLHAYGDSMNGNAPVICAPTIATQILYAPDIQPGNVPVFSPAMILANTQLIIDKPLTIHGSVVIGQQGAAFPGFSVLKKGSLFLNGQSLQQAAQLNGGQIVGLSQLFCDQPSLPFNPSGTTYDLFGGSIYGSSTIFN